MLSLKLGQLALAAGCTVQAIRLYHREGVLPLPNLSGTKYASYDEQHLNSLHHIVNCRATGLSYAQIGQIAAAVKGAGLDQTTRQALTVHLRKVKRTIAQLQATEVRLETVLSGATD